MKAIHIATGGDEPRLVWTETEDPVARENEVLVRVGAAGVNRADLMQARGHYPVPAGASTILGLEIAGTVVQVPPDAGGIAVGSRVCALVAGGGYAELAAVDHRMLLELPDGWDFSTGAAVPEAWLTAYVNLFREGGLARGESVLVHAGASGVGTAAIQLAREAGARVFATAGTREKCAVCRSLGSDRAVNYRSEDFLEVVLQETGHAGVDLVLDPVGADYLTRNLAALAEHGRLIQIGLLSGGRADVDFSPILRKSLVVRGSRLRPRPLQEKIDITRGFRERFWQALAGGRMKPVIDRSFDIREAGEAHRHVRENRNAGKVILSVPH